MSERIENKVDRLSDQVTDLKVEHTELRGDVKHMSQKFDEHIQIVKDHVAGDTKIVNALLPILPHIAEMAEDHVTRKRKESETKEKRATDTEKLKLWGLRISVFIGTTSIIGMFVEWYTDGWISKLL